MSTPQTRYGGIADGDMEYPGEDMGRVSGRCHALEQAPGRRRRLHIPAADIGSGPPD